MRLLGKMKKLTCARQQLEADVIPNTYLKPIKKKKKGKNIIQAGHSFPIKALQKLWSIENDLKPF